MIRGWGKIYSTLGALLLAGGLLVFLLMAATAPYQDVSFGSERAMVLDKGWFWQDSQGRWQQIELPAKLPAGDDNRVVVYRTLPEDISLLSTLCFRSSQQAVRVCLDGEEIYAYGTDPAAIAYGESPGSAWNLVRLPEGAAGRTVSIELTAAYGTYAGTVNQVRIGTKSALLFAIGREHLPVMLLSLLIFLVGAGVCALYAILSRSGALGRSLLYLGEFAVLVSVWMFGESRMIQFFSGNMLLILAITFAALMAFPIPAVQYVRSLVDARYSRVYSVVLWVLYLQLGGTFLLQALGVCDFIEMTPVIHIVLIGVSLASLGPLALDWRRRCVRGTWPMMLSLLLLCLSGILEVAWFYAAGGLHTGIFLRLGILAFILIQAVHSVGRGIEIINRSREASYYERLATWDVLTQCENRTAYSNRLGQLKDGRDLAVVMADLNDLKRINDTLGHSVGDHAIILCTQCLRRVFGSLGNCYRIGGDEFLFLGLGLSSQCLAERLEELERECARQAEKVSFPFSMAVGGALFDEALDHSAEDVVRRADRAMYQRKEEMKGSVGA